MRGFNHSFLIVGTAKLGKNAFVHKGHIRNIFSLYAVTSENFDDNGKHTIDDKIIEFGSSCLLIKDNPYFIEQ